MKQDYFEFVEKFKPKKTTDDCYTPENAEQIELTEREKEMQRMIK